MVCILKWSRIEFNTVLVLFPSREKNEHQSQIWGLGVPYKTYLMILAWISSARKTGEEWEFVEYFGKHMDSSDSFLWLFEQEWSPQAHRLECWSPGSGISRKCDCTGRSASLGYTLRSRMLKPGGAHSPRCCRSFPSTMSASCCHASRHDENGRIPNLWPCKPAPIRSVLSTSYLGYGVSPQQ